jgi:F-type H+-transporting ATPase subunit b
MSLDISQIISQIVAFLIMLWVLKKFGWKPLMNLLEERKKLIQAEFESIAAQKDEVKKQENEYREKIRKIDEESRSKIQEAVAEGRKLAKEIQDNAQENAKSIISKAKAEVDDEIAHARIQLKDEIVDIAIAVAEKILDQRLDSATQKKLIVDFVEEAKIK